MPLTSIKIETSLFLKKVAKGIDLSESVCYSYHMKRIRHLQQARRVPQASLWARLGKVRIGWIFEGVGFAVFLIVWIGAMHLVGSLFN